MTPREAWIEIFRDRIDLDSTEDNDILIAVQTLDFYFATKKECHECGGYGRLENKEGKIVRCKICNGGTES